MKPIFILVVLSLLVLCPGAMGDAMNPEIQSCDKAESTADMTICSEREYKKTDAVLKKVYQQVIDKINEFSASVDDKAFVSGYKKALNASEDAWTKFRDVDCDFATYDRTGGSSRLMNVYDCKAELTNARIKELQKIAQEML